MMGVTLTAENKEWTACLIGDARPLLVAPKTVNSVGNGAEFGMDLGSRKLEKALAIVRARATSASAHAA